MMGFGEEEGVIPRFCQELFLNLASMQKAEVKDHIHEFIVSLFVSFYVLLSKAIYLNILDSAQFLRNKKNQTFECVQEHLHN